MCYTQELDISPKHIACLVGEAYVIVCAGMPGDVGEYAARPGHNGLDSFRILFLDSTSFSAMNIVCRPKR